MGGGDGEGSTTLLAAAGTASLVKRILGMEAQLSSAAPHADTKDAVRTASTVAAGRPPRINVLARGNLCNASKTVLNKGLYVVDGAAADAAASGSPDTRPVSAPASVSLSHSNASMVALGTSSLLPASDGAVGVLADERFAPKTADLSRLAATLESRMDMGEDLDWLTPGGQHGFVRSRMPAPIRTSTPPPDLSGGLRRTSSRLGGSGGDSAAADLTASTSPAATLMRRGIVHDQFSETERSIVARVDHLRTNPDEFARQVVDSFPIVRPWDGYGSAALHALNVTSPPPVSAMDPETPAEELLSSIEIYHSPLESRRKLELLDPLTPLPPAADAPKGGSNGNGAVHTKKRGLSPSASAYATPLPTPAMGPVAGTPQVRLPPPLRALTFNNASRMREVIEQDMIDLQERRETLEEAVEEARKAVDAAMNPPAQPAKGKPKGKGKEPPPDPNKGPSADLLEAQVKLRRAQKRVVDVDTETESLEARLRRVETALNGGINQVRCLFKLKPVGSISYSHGLSLSARECCMDEGVVMEQVGWRGARGASPAPPAAPLTPGTPHTPGGSAAGADESAISLADLPDLSPLQRRGSGSGLETPLRPLATPPQHRGKSVHFAPTPNRTPVLAGASSPVVRQATPKPGGGGDPRTGPMGRGERGLTGSPKGSDANSDFIYGRALGSTHCVVALDPAHTHMTVESLVMDSARGLQNIAHLTDSGVHHVGCGWRRFDSRATGSPADWPRPNGAPTDAGTKTAGAVVVLLLAGLYQDSHLVRLRRHLPLQTVHHELRKGQRPPPSCTFPVTFFPCDAADAAGGGGGAVRTARVKALSPTEHPVAVGNVADLYLAVPTGVDLCASLDHQAVPIGSVQANHARVFIQPAVGYQQSRPGTGSDGGVGPPAARVMHVQVRLPGVGTHHLHVYAAPAIGGRRYKHIGSVMLACDDRSGFRAETAAIGYPVVTPEHRSGRVHILSPLINPLREGAAYAFEVRVEAGCAMVSENTRRLSDVCRKREGDQARLRRRLDALAAELRDIEDNLAKEAAGPPDPPPSASPAGKAGKGKAPPPPPPEPTGPIIDVEALNARKKKLTIVHERVRAEHKYVSLQVAVARQELEAHGPRAIGPDEPRRIELTSPNFNQNVPLPAGGDATLHSKVVHVSKGKLALMVDGVCIAHWRVESTSYPPPM